MNINNKYLIDIFERYTDLKNSNKQEFDNFDLCKIFEYYSCFKLSKEYDKLFYEYNDIEPDFKELNKMSRDDTGIDCCDSTPFGTRKRGMINHARFLVKNQFI